MFSSLGLSRPIVTLLAAFLAISSIQNKRILVSSFVPIQRQSQAARTHVGTSISDPLHHRGRGDAVTSSTTSSFGNAPRTTHRLGRQANQQRLSAVPQSAWWILGHATLPLSGVPFVTKSTREGGWYRKIDLPPWTPPDRLFGPVWTFLYSCMGLAVSRISRFSSSPASGNPLLLLWGAHFATNLVWAPVFFGLQRFRLGLIINYVLVGSLAVIIPLFHAVDPTSAHLLLPYALWLSFATFGLNLEICRRNPTINGYNAGMFQAQLKKLQDAAAVYAGLK